MSVSVPETGWGFWSRNTVTWLAPKTFLSVSASFCVVPLPVPEGTCAELGGRSVNIRKSANTATRVIQRLMGCSFGLCVFGAVDGNAESSLYKHADEVPAVIGVAAHVGNRFRGGLGEIGGFVNQGIRERSVHESGAGFRHIERRRRHRGQTDPRCHA